jgi:hypothetical protein
MDPKAVLESAEWASRAAFNTTILSPKRALISIFWQSIRQGIGLFVSMV